MSEMQIIVSFTTGEQVHTGDRLIIRNHLVYAYRQGDTEPQIGTALNDAPRWGDVDVVSGRVPIIVSEKIRKG